MGFVFGSKNSSFGILMNWVYLGWAVVV